MDLHYNLNWVQTWYPNIRAVEDSTQLRLCNHCVWPHKLLSFYFYIVTYTIILLLKYKSYYLGWTGYWTLMKTVLLIRQQYVQENWSVSLIFGVNASSLWWSHMVYVAFQHLYSESSNFSQIQQLKQNEKL